MGRGTCRDLCGVQDPVHGSVERGLPEREVSRASRKKPVLLDGRDTQARRRVARSKAIACLTARQNFMSGSNHFLSS